MQRKGRYRTVDRQVASPRLAEIPAVRETNADELDDFDMKLLAALQQDGSLGPTELSPLINLSPSQCSRRLQRLRTNGYFARQAVILSRTKLGLGVSAYIAVKLRDHDAAAREAFATVVRDLPEIVSCDYLTGETDFMLRIVTRDLESYSTFLTDKLLTTGVVETIRSSIILKELKQTTAFPLDFC